jgi:2,3-dihydroxy-p-cumate/2,3-dihydroxybenzoate 3,4-dioxygenase
MSVISRLGYLAVGVSNLDEAVDYYSRFVRLDVTERTARTAFMTGGLEHHWLRLEEGSGDGLKRIGYVVEDDAALVEVRARLSAAGIPFTEGGDLASERVDHWLRFQDPGGIDIELYTRMFERGVAPMNPGITMQKFLHAGWATPNFEQTTDFYQQVLGFKVSDWVENRAGFFRAGNRYHHSLVLIRSDRALFNHFCIQVESLDDVMRARHNALKGGVALRDDLLRHAPSGSVGLYTLPIHLDFRMAPATAVSGGIRSLQEQSTGTGQLIVMEFTSSATFGCAARSVTARSTRRA